MELIGQGELELSPLRIDTTAMWLQPPPNVLKAVADAGCQKHEALAGVRNLLLVSLPPLAMADRHDIGGIVDSSQLGRPTIFLYDRYEGGVGYARHGYEHADDLLRMAYELVSGCDCEDGCPGCVGPANLRPPLHHDPDIYKAYDFPDKRATIALLRAWHAT
jgi:DEAD/DEAH box helicase domain-containing protein